MLDCVSSVCAGFMMPLLLRSAMLVVFDPLWHGAERVACMVYDLWLSVFINYHSNDLIRQIEKVTKCNNPGIGLQVSMLLAAADALPPQGKQRFHFSA